MSGGDRFRVTLRDGARGGSPAVAAGGLVSLCSAPPSRPRPCTPTLAPSEWPVGPGAAAAGGLPHGLFSVGLT